ncbi:GerAB/ArcD/ProY family transporter [Paenibacillus thalictri]|uniref:Uncharacterized protein n=1 Tax=Paenibacillus thalictri TaxID=2527873 RepID=A0A4V2J3P8_9BACL|nr:GerAB/ArcD/ProY family transporter [Paenibacillus thalictri]TBL74612.1 hypothetical protein EYB31_25170 [Paenibacillus thalictri]
MDKSTQVAVMYIVTHMGLIFFLYPTDIIASFDHGHWLAILVGYLLHVLVIWMYMKGIHSFDQLNIVEICKRSGNILAVLLLVPATLYLLAVVIITVRAYSEIVTIIFLANTPLWAIMVLLLAISAYIAMLGPETMFRSGVLLCALLVVPIVFVICSSFQNTDVRYLLPLWDRYIASFSFLRHRSYYQSLFAFASGFLFLGFTPGILTYRPKTILLSSFILLPLFLMSVYIPIFTFGQSTAERFQFPFIMAIDTIEMNWLMFDRITMFFLLSLIIFIMLLIALTLWQIVCVIQTSVYKIKTVWAVPLLSVIVYVICLQIPDWSTVERFLWWNTILRLYVLTVIPIGILWLGTRHKKQLSR